MKWLAPAVATALFLAQGCAGPGIPKGSPADAPPAAQEPAPEASPAPAPSVGALLTTETLRNAAYRWWEGGRNLIQFRDGKFRGPVEPGSTEEVRVSMLDRIGRGDLDADGIDDAALVFVHDPGGTKTYYMLVAVINQSGVPEHRSEILLGDRIQVGAVTIESGKIFVEVVRPQSGDAGAAPGRRIKESYKLVAGRLERADYFR